ncbi:MAG: hypothetical protein A2X59_00170 [Nitrospirae bacterium GWC2_42_7]|nr:MAG: hypothetical protein A2X59_00170 [Nitrospirae bacterium GWC2_42_7]
MLLDSRPYLIRNCEREGRFGMDEEPKFWVKRAIDLESGQTKIIKLVFHEKFRTKVGDLTFDCARSPRKEARILVLVKGHPNFMQGFSVQDSAGNIVRIIDYIRGRTFGDEILDLGKNHEDYFYHYFPRLFDEYLELVESIKFLHDHSEKHGDIRRDHIIRDKDTNQYRWIDFDYNYIHKENLSGYDMFGLGNILVYLVGHGDIIIHQLKQENPPVFNRIVAEDLNIIFNNRVVNLKKIYPYIPDALNLVLLHFSLGTNIFYEDTRQLLEDIHEARDKILKL